MALPIETNDIIFNNSHKDIIFDRIEIYSSYKDIIYKCDNIRKIEDNIEIIDVMGNIQLIKFKDKSNKTHTFTVPLSFMVHLVQNGN